MKKNIEPINHQKREKTMQYTNKKTKLLTAIQLALATAALAMLASPANAALDFSGVTGAVDGATVVAAITTVAAIKILPGAAKWGYNKVIGWFR